MTLFRVSPALFALAWFLGVFICGAVFLYAEKMNPCVVMVASIFGVVCAFVILFCEPRELNDD
ncbi:MAG: hypothetical protein V6Z86_05530 [Hyphomicrobiales bacterium]